MRRLDRLPPPTGRLRDDALGELRWAMAYEGLTADKLSVMPAVCELPAVRAAMLRVPASSRLAVGYRVIVDAARELGGSVHARILRAALAIDYDADARNLTARRREFEPVGDLRTIRDIEERMLAALVTMLGGVSAGDRAASYPEAGGTAEQAPIPRGPVWNVPALRDPHFVGRDRLLEELRRRFTSESGEAAVTSTIVQVLAGPSGIGKTALAAEYTYTHVAAYDVVWWVRAEMPSVLAADFAGLATTLGLVRDGAGQAEGVAAARTWLATHDRWLLVFDDAGADDDVAPYVPGLQGHVLVTSRNPHWSAIATAIDVPSLDRDAAAELVRRRTGVDDVATSITLAWKLDGIPKLLDVAAGMFARGSGASLARFTERLGDGTAATQGVWDAAFAMADATVGTREVLAACTTLDPDDIQIDLLVAGTGLGDAEVDGAVGALRAQQILRRGVDGLTMHRLVQATAAERLGEAARRHAATRLARVLLDIDVLGSRPVLAYGRRVQTQVPYIAAALGDAEPAGELFAWYAQCLRRDGAYEEAVAIAERAVAHAEAIHGPSHAIVGDRLDALTLCLRDAGHLPAARAVAERTLAVVGEARGPDHEDTGRALYALATILSDLGQLAAARDAAARAYTVSAAANGPNHPDTARALDVLAWVLRELGDLPAAQDAAERALAATEAAVGPAHLDVAWRLDTLAVILRGTGALAAARAAIERSMAIAENVLGPDYPQRGPQLGVLARILRRIGDLHQARARAEEAVVLTSAAAGRDHPVTAVELGNLALVLADLGELAAARDAVERAIAVTSAALGERHPDVGWQLALAARVLADLGQPGQARSAAERSIAIAEDALGTDHPAVAARRRLLARLPDAIRT